MSNYYVSGCIADGDNVSICDDSAAQFWTLYHRNDDGLSEGIIDCVFREDAEAAMRVYEHRDALAAENATLKSRRNLGYINLSDLLPEAWYFQLTLEIPNLDNMTPYQAHGAAWKQSRSHILRKLEEMACTDSQAILLPDLGVEFTSVPAHLENTLTCDEKNAWLSGANSIRTTILHIAAQLRAGKGGE